MNIVVTGGAGFIGSHLTDRLLEQGYRVIVVDNLSTGSRELVAPEAEFYEMDIRDTQLAELFVREKIDYVFHEAAQTMVNASMENPQYDCDVNLMGLLNVLEACRKAQVKKILMPSSAAVYGDCTSLPLTETMQGTPSSFYGLTKLTSEHYLALYAEHFGLPYICYRYSNVYGPRQGNGGEGGVVSIFCQHIREGKPFVIYGDGTQTRDFIYVEDVVAANLAGIAHPEVTGIFNVSTGQGLSVNALVETLSALSGENWPVTYEAPRLGDIQDSRLCREKAKAVLEWEPVVSLQEGLKMTYDYFTRKI